jgi:type IV pilus assembly protein PilC
VPEFVCRVATLNGEIFERSYVADDEGALRRDLDGQDLLLLDVRRRSALLRQLARTFRLRGTVSVREFLLFNQELRALIRAGLPIMASLEILQERRQNPAFRQALADIRDRVKAGEALSEAFAAQGELFPKLFSASLASAERSGEMVSVLSRYIDYTQKVLRIQRKVVSALIYPVILLVLAGALVAVMVFFVIPRFNEILADFGGDLPWITRAIVGGAMFAGRHWQLLVAALVAASVLVGLWNRSEGGRWVLDRFKLRLPLVGRIVANYAQNRFTRTLATLQAGGIPLVTSLELAARSVGHAVYERSLLAVAGDVREGKALWESLAATGLMSEIAVQMVKVGESTGALEEMLNDASDFTDEEIDTMLTRVMSLIEPLMLVFMAIVVGIMLLSIYLPLIQLYGQTRGF